MIGKLGEGSVRWEERRARINELELAIFDEQRNSPVKENQGVEWVEEIGKWTVREMDRTGFSSIRWVVYLEETDLSAENALSCIKGRERARAFQRRNTLTCFLNWVIRAEGHSGLTRRDIRQIEKPLNEVKINIQDSQSVWDWNWEKSSYFVDNSDVWCRRGAQ